MTRLRKHAKSAPRSTYLRAVATLQLVLIMLTAMVTLAAPVEASTRPQVVNNCHHVAVRPHSSYSCVQWDDILVNHIEWKSWGSKTAVGYGIGHFNTCKPYCAAGNYQVFRVKLTLFRVVKVGTHRRFTRWVFYTPTQGRSHVHRLLARAG